MFGHSEFIKKTICHRSSEDSIAKKLLFKKNTEKWGGDPSKKKKKLSSILMKLEI